MSDQDLEHIVSLLDEKHAKRSRIDWLIKVFGFIGTILTIGFIGGDWHGWRDTTNDRVNKLERYVYPTSMQAETNREKAIKNRYAPVKTGE